MQYCKGTGTYRHYKHLYRRRKTDEGHGRTSEQFEDVGGWGKATYHAIPTSHTVFVPETCFMVVENLPVSVNIDEDTRNVEQSGKSPPPDKKIQERQISLSPV